MITMERPVETRTVEFVDGPRHGLELGRRGDETMPKFILIGMDGVALHPVPVEALRAYKFCADGRYHYVEAE